MVNIKIKKLIPILTITFLLITGIIYFNSALAESSYPVAPGIQVAYFIGYHDYYGGGAYRPGHRPAYWSGWKYIGRSCQSNCLIDRWSGKILRCSRRCF